ncbi:MAG: helix-hairpin-helix domain-containing protein, partial [Solirubrobacteraceae bacterium]
MDYEAPITVRHVRFANEQSGWAVLDAAEADGTPVVLVGPLVHLEQGERAHVRGAEVNDSRYGPQVKVSEARPLPPEDPQTLIIYLRRVKHVGAKRAAELVKRFGPEAVLDVVDRDPAAAFGQIGLRHHRAQEAAESWQKLRVTRRLHLLLAPHGLAYLAPRIHEHYGSGAHELVARNPYELTSVFGVGFALADRIARASAQPIPEGQRERAAIMHVLAESERSGSSCTPLPVLVSEARGLLGAEPPEELVDAMVLDGRIVREQEWIYRAATAELEAELAQRVADLVTDQPVERLSHGPEPGVTSLTEEQLSALH